MAQPAYRKVLNQRVREPFKALGLVKFKASSWLDDHGWWATLVNLQPSKHGDGAFLNVGVCWLYYPKDFLSFDLGGRLLEQVTYESDQQFAPLADLFAERARQEVELFRAGLTTPASAWQFVRDYRLDRPPGDLWVTFNNGVLAALAGDLASARALLGEVASAETQHDWERERASTVQRLVRALDTSQLAPTIATMVEQTRALLRLPPRPTHD